MLKHFREMVKVAEEEGAVDISIEQGKGHPKLVAYIGGERIRYTFPSTTADWRVLSAARTYFRRARRGIIPGR